MIVIQAHVVESQICDLVTKAKFHVIDADTSFRALLGRLWLHEYGMVPSTMHQCIKYLREGEEFRIPGNLQPFTVHEAKIYEDAKYFFPKEPQSRDPSKTMASSS